MTAHKLALGQWDDVLHMDAWLTAEERQIREAAHAYCQDK